MKKIIIFSIIVTAIITYHMEAKAETYTYDKYLFYQHNHFLVIMMELW
ncbi:MAG: hypothetical protein IJN92_02685 [Lachnospiraceae bacterium]|nr:hypothetical protein [Lachnospiraceae bacterium]